MSNDGLLSFCFLLSRQFDEPAGFLHPVSDKTVTETRRLILFVSLFSFQRAVVYAKKKPLGSGLGVHTKHVLPTPFHHAYSEHHIRTHSLFDTLIHVKCPVGNPENGLNRRLFEHVRSCHEILGNRYLYPFVSEDRLKGYMKRFCRHDGRLRQTELKAARVLGNHGAGK